MKILVECHHAIGDVVMTFSALKNLREAYPEAEITYMGGHNLEIPLLKATGCVDNVCVYNVREQGLLELAFLGLRLRKNHYDLAISFGASARGWDVLFLKLVGCKKIVAMENPCAICKKYIQVDVSKQKHRVEKEVEIVKAVGGAGNISEITVDAIQKRDDFTLQKYGITGNKKIVGLLLGTGDFMYREHGKIVLYNTKRWELSNFCELADRLIVVGYEIILFGGVKEKEELSASEIHFNEKVINLLGECDLLTTISWMKSCALVVGGDSGPMHCAAAVGVPTLTLFGPTDAEIIGPYGKRAHYLYGDYECTKCYSECNEKGRTCKDINCMKSITVQKVYEKILRVMKTSYEKSSIN